MICMAATARTTSTHATGIGPLSLVEQEAHIGGETVRRPHHVIADLARHVMLVSGDMALLGTPCHLRSADAGDLVERDITAPERVAGTIVAIDAPRANVLGVDHQLTDAGEVGPAAFSSNERVPDHFKGNLRSAKNGTKP